MCVCVRHKFGHRRTIAALSIRPFDISYIYAKSCFFHQHEITFALFYFHFVLFFLFRINICYTIFTIFVLRGVRDARFDCWYCCYSHGLWLRPVQFSLR